MLTKRQNNNNNNNNNNNREMWLIKIYKLYLKYFKNYRTEFPRKAKGNLHVNICSRTIFEVQLNQVLTTTLLNFYLWGHLIPLVNSVPIENKETLQRIVYVYPTICHLTHPILGHLKICDRPWSDVSKRTLL
jgi:hypothetical protein